MREITEFYKCKKTDHVFFRHSKLKKDESAPNGERLISFYSDLPKDQSLDGFILISEEEYHEQRANLQKFRAERIAAIKKKREEKKDRARKELEQIGLSRQSINQILGGFDNE